MFFYKKVICIGMALFILNFQNLDSFFELIYG